MIWFCNAKVKVNPLVSMSLSWSSAISSFTSSANQTPPKARRRFGVESLKRSSKAASVGLVKDSKKELSRILRTESAIRGVENKATSSTHRQLWPKALLQALHDAIKRCRSHTSLQAHVG
uniref:Pentatricopeptide repeat-containing protein At3g53170 family n=1 Tax=Cajanus cajan TaxID=3821 RepID=A0A151S010_CAJCA|nr:Pentatricopeptide repeat-containing protein At3g53170 family [Cajanus cajan]